MKSSASAPSATTCSRPGSPACANACLKSSASSALSSTNRISAVSSGMSSSLSEGEEKRRALFRLGLGPDAATVPVDDALHDGQADARALKFVGPMQPLKHSEKLSGILHVE